MNEKGEVYMEFSACSFTGHRRIETRHIGSIDELVMRAITYAYSHGCRRFYCGGAIGFDTVAAKQVILFRLTHADTELHMLLPCRNQSDKWSDGQIRMYEYIMSSANTVSYISDEYRDGCMRERNKKLAELADIVVAYLSRESSGAGQTVRMAKAQGKTVYNLYPALDNED